MFLGLKRPDKIPQGQPKGSLVRTLAKNHKLSYGQWPNDELSMGQWTIDGLIFP